MLFILLCKDHPGALSVRTRARLPHLDFVADHVSAFRYGGPLIGGTGQPEGSLMILDLPDRAALDAHMRADPFFSAGLFESVTIWTSQQVVPETAPGGLRAEIERQRVAA
jgi:hypothetical protein